MLPWRSGGRWAGGPHLSAAGIARPTRALREDARTRPVVDAYRYEGVRLNMANNPKKVKDPTEVALSAIQEALNISDPSADTGRDNGRSAQRDDHDDAAPPA